MREFQEDENYFKNYYQNYFKNQEHQNHILRESQEQQNYNPQEVLILELILELLELSRHQTTKITRTFRTF